jgi:site-specific recombinase XerD
MTLPAKPETIAMFVASQAAGGLSPSTLTRRLAAIRLIHLGAGHPSPHNTIQVIEVMSGIRRNWGKPPNRKAPALVEDIKKMVDAVEPDTKKGLRDRALILFGFAGAFRRSELVGLNTWNLEERCEGVKVTIEKSKTDQEALGQVIAIVRQPDSPYCPVQALQDWLTNAEIQNGALFRRMYRGDNVGTAHLSPQSVAMIIKDYANKVGLDSAQYSGHSLRRGFLTSAARNRANIFKMADHSRHKSLDVLRQYVQEGEMFENNAGDGLL